MSLAGRKQVAAWLRRQAKMLTVVTEYTDDIFRARYLYTPPVKK
jgi:hypothetical protein